MTDKRRAIGLRDGTAAVLFGAFLVVFACRGSTSAPPVARDPADERSQALLRANAPLPSDPRLADTYGTINARYFDSRLPPVRIRWEPRLADVGPLVADGFRLEGVTDGAVILLHPVLMDDERQFRAVLCHEMVHVALRDQARTHGPEFQARLRALLDKGAFEGVIGTDEEKQQLKQSLETRAARLSSELAELNDARAQIEAEAATLPRETLQDRTWTFNMRVRRHNEDADEYNRMVERYNLMTAYPDGLDGARMRERAVGALPR